MQANSAIFEARKSILAEPKLHNIDEQIHVLLCVVGGTPAVVTETIYALAVEREVPLKRLRLVTTTEGRREIERQLLRLTGEESGGWHLLRRDYPPTRAIAFKAEEDILVPRGEDGKPLGDIRTTGDNNAMAEALLAELRLWSERPDTVLHASVAGGRKTMSLLLGSVMQLAARPGDRLYHVLVPQEYEGLPGFYYPTPKRLLLPNRQGIPIDASAARLDLAEIPFVRYRALLHGEQDRNCGFGELVEQAQRRLATATQPVAIRLHWEEAMLEFVNPVSGETLTETPLQPPSLTGFYLYFALCRRAAQEDPWVSLFDSETGGKALRDIARNLRESRGALSPEAERFDRYAKEIEQGDGGNLSALRSNWNHWLRKVGSQWGVHPIDRFEIASRRDQGRAWYAVRLDRELIILDDQ